jgi:hypothetical protein
MPPRAGFYAGISERDIVQASRKLSRSFIACIKPMIAGPPKPIANC